MKLLILVGVGTVLLAVGLVSGHSAALMAAVIALKLAWLAGVVQAARAREWWWAVGILVGGVIPGVAYNLLRLSGPRTAEQPISVLRG